jgi:hypothetical protein
MSERREACSLWNSQISNALLSSVPDVPDSEARSSPQQSTDCSTVNPRIARTTLPALLVDECETVVVQQERVSVCRLCLRRVHPRLALTNSDTARTAVSHAGLQHVIDRRDARDRRVDHAVDSAASKVERARLSRYRECTLDRRRARLLARRSPLNGMTLLCLPPPIRTNDVLTVMSQHSRVIAPDR